jgi:hypothetical protein
MIHSRLVAYVLQYYYACMMYVKHVLILKCLYLYKLILAIHAHVYLNK